MIANAREARAKGDFEIKNGKVPDNQGDIIIVRVHTSDQAGMER